MALHEHPESLLIRLRLDTGQLGSILVQYLRLDKPLRLLIEVPLLQVVYDAKVDHS